MDYVRGTAARVRQLIAEGGSMHLLVLGLGAVGIFVLVYFIVF